MIRTLFTLIILVLGLSCKSIALKRSNTRNCIQTYQINLGDSLEEIKSQNLIDLSESGVVEYDYYKILIDSPQNNDPFILGLSTIHAIGSLIKIKLQKKKVSNITIIWMTDEFDIASPERLEKFLYQVSSRHFNCFERFHIPEFVPLDCPHTCRIEQQYIFEELSVSSLGPYNAVSYEIGLLN